MTTDLQQLHLPEIRGQLAMLCARLEETTKNAPDARLRDEVRHLTDFATHILGDVCLAEQCARKDEAADEAVRELKARYRQSGARIAELKRRIDAIRKPQAPDLDSKPADTGSDVGNAVRDAWLNM